MPQINPNPKNNQKPDILTDVEASKYLRVAVQTLRNWRFQGRGPAYIKMPPTPRGKVFYQLEDLKTYRDSCRIEPGA